MYLAYYATSFAAGTRVNGTLKILKDDLKTSAKSNCMGVSTEFSKFAREEAKP